MTIIDMYTDFIVIGSGLAGLTSALSLADFGKVLIVTKGKVEEGATSLAQGGVAAVVDRKDSFLSHIQDTLVAGCFHNKRKAVTFLVKKGPQAIKWLVEQGVPFDHDQNNFSLGKEAAHSFPRILHATDFTGWEIEMTLVRNVKKNKNIKIWEDTFVKKLLIKDGRCFGIRVTDPAAAAEVGHDFFAHLPNSPRPLQGLGSNTVGVLKKHSLPAAASLSHNPFSIDCFGKLVVLATGGLGQIYQWTTNPYVSTGDGLAMAYRAGAKLKDLEFIQFHPTALKDGKSPLFLLSEALRGEGAYLTKLKIKNEKLKIKEKGERFMKDYDERMELAPRDIVARAIFKEQKEGYKVYLDIRHKGEKFLQKRFPNIYRELKKRGFNLAKDLIPVTPATHYSCGGVVTDLYGRTNIRNLFAFGEVASTGVHGANRLASNSLLESVVFPLQLLLNLRGSCRLANGSCPEFPSTPSSKWTLAGRPPVDIKGALLARQSDSDGGPGALPLVSPICLPVILASAADSIELGVIRKNLQRLMWEKVGIIRSRQQLKEAKEQIIKWERELRGEGGNRKLLELKNMLLVARLVTQAALKRKKSLGAHFVSCI